MAEGESIFLDGQQDILEANAAYFQEPYFFPRSRE